tara:strand:- start:31941 stop:32177 length:237 start_codon:yes stop_codon:yes gene_type:complete
MNQKIKLLSVLLSKEERKALRLLSNQYIIESIFIEPNEYCGQIMISENPMVIRYFSPEDPSNKFEWILDPINYSYDDN